MGTSDIADQEKEGVYDMLRKKNAMENQEILTSLGLKSLTFKGVDGPSMTRKRESRVPTKKRHVDSSDDESEESDTTFDDDYHPEEEELVEESPKNKRKRSGVADKKPKFSTTKLSKESRGRALDQTADVAKIPRYPKRDARPNNEDDYIPTVDDLMYCADCKVEWKGDCPTHGPLIAIMDKPVPLDIKNKKRAAQTAPDLVVISDSMIPGAGLGVWTSKPVQPRIRFGPYEGVVSPASTFNTYTWLIRKNKKEHHCIDATEEGLSNWMRYVNCARYDGEQNLVAYQYHDQIYYRAARYIKPEEELLVWYGDEYGRQLGINPKICDAADKEKYRELLFKCNDCDRSFGSPMYLQRHKKLCKNVMKGKDYKGLRGDTFVCPGCDKMFAGFEFIKRHKEMCKELQKKERSVDEEARQEFHAAYKARGREVPFR